VGQRELECDAAAVGCADERDSIELQLAQQRLEVVEVRERPRQKLRVAEPTQVAANDAVSRAGERLHLRLPHAAVGDSRVEEENGGAAAGYVMRKLGYVTPLCR